MSNLFSCDGYGCRKEAESKGMIYLKWPSVVDAEIRRFCSKSCFINWTKEAGLEIPHKYPETPAERGKVTVHDWSTI